jgi:serine O-acetyltransferase
MRSAFLADCQRRNGNEWPTPWRALCLTFNDHGLQALLGYRLGRHLLDLGARRRGWLRRLLGWPIYFLIRGYVRTALDIRLELSADIGPGLYIGHFGNVLVERCKVGEHCSIAQSTHLCADGRGQGPVVGDRVWIGAHARIIGLYRIGDRATVSAGAVLKRDIPTGALCVGNPAKVVLIDYDNSEIL